MLYKQKTAYEVRINDWSSDVCSSDLIASQDRGRTRPRDRHAGRVAELQAVSRSSAAERRECARRHCRRRRADRAAAKGQVMARVMQRSEEQRVGKGGGSTGRTGWSP